MKINFKKRAGFTLIEMVATLVLAGIVLVFATMLLETSTKVFINSKDAAEDSQKIQIAMNRLIKELTYAGNGSVVISNGGRTIQWDSRYPDRGGAPGTLTWNGTSGSDLQYSTTNFDGIALLDNVSSFSASTSAGAITITLKTRRSDAVAHTVTFHPRYDL